MFLNKVSVIFIFLFSPLIFAQTVNISEQLADCGVKGSITIYDYKNKQWYYSDKSDAKIPTLPASTFKIINSLIALETKAVQDEKEIIAWDGGDKKFFGASMKEWNKDTNLEEAYKNSTVWFYVEVAKRIGFTEYKKFLAKANYGNADLKFNQDGDFWNYGGFAVSPVEQINFLVRLYNNELPFSKKNMESFKQMMISNDDNNGILRGKTGWTRKNGKDIGWYVGFVEKKENVYFFATRINNAVYPENNTFSKCRTSITLKALSSVIPNFEIQK